MILADAAPLSATKANDSHHGFHPARPFIWGSLLDVESKVHYIAFLDNVLLALQTQLARLFGARLAFELDEVLVGDHFSADKAALEIGVDDAGRLRRGRARMHRPGAYFFRRPP